jgi:hypothetical protein
MKAGNQFPRVILAIGLLSSATLLFETALTRFLAVAQFYHFAFLVVSLALLGFGASGTLISIFPILKEKDLLTTLGWVGLGLVGSIWGAFAVVNFLPFDSYSIAWDSWQILYFVLYYFSLSLPFLVSGLGLGLALAVIDEKHNLVYAANLIGSGVGVLLAPGVMALSGIIGVLLVCGILGLGCWYSSNLNPTETKRIRGIFSISSVICLGAWISLLALNLLGRAPLGLVISPYKGLAQARRFPEAELLFGKWNAASRVDVMADAGTRRVPGLSYLYNGEIPDQHGLSVDGSALQPITLTSPDDFQAGEWMPEWWALSLLPSPDVLVLDPGAGMGIIQAVAAGANTVSTVIENRLVLEGAQTTAPGYPIFQRDQVKIHFDSRRAFLQQNSGRFDLVFLPLTDPYQPVTNGVYSISENYLITVEGLSDALQSLAPGGVFVSSRWLQTPPSEGLRLVATLLESLEEQGFKNPQDNILIFRGIQILTVLVKPDGWNTPDLKSFRLFLERCHFDLVWSPDIQEWEMNRWNVLPEPVYYHLVRDLFQSSNREDFYRSYPYNISPPTDDHPFFFHYFTWEQTPDILESLGKTWQPFGGSGYLLLFFLLALVLFLSGIMILLPLIFRRKYRIKKVFRGTAGALFYFGLIGVGFMFIEIPLIGQWTLFLNTPIAAFTMIVGVLLLSSGFGSMTASKKWRHQELSYILLILLGGGSVIIFTLNKGLVLSWPMWNRYIAAIVGLAPLGFSMGIFFPRGISWIKSTESDLVPWAWAVNGSASVIASVLSAILFLQFGFPAVLICGGVFYLCAWLIHNRF